MKFRTQRRGAPRAWLAAAALAFFLILPALPLQGYSVLGHEALIDAAWQPFIVPLLRSRYPNITDAQLESAHAYAYGGCVIQDMGYYPLGNKFFSELTHYVRTGDFVQALLHDSTNLYEYAFALGALSHYIADNTGHPMAVNLSVADMYPRLRRMYGKRVTYEDDPTAHIMTEFSFDVVQITGAGYLPKTYHNFVGFKVPKRLLNRAFTDTYGLKLGRLFFSEDLSLVLYKLSASEIIPDLGQILWRRKHQKFYRVDPKIVTSRFRYRLAKENYERPRRRRYSRLRFWGWHWKTAAGRADVRFFSKALVTVVEILPKVGPLRSLQFKPPTVQVQDLFIEAFDVTVARYDGDLSRLHGHDLVLPENNLDTGKAVHAGAYTLADDTYARLLNRLARSRFRDLTPDLRQDILAYYQNLAAPIVTKDHPRKWQRTLRQLTALKNASVQSEIASH